MQRVRYINPKGKEVVFSKAPPFILEKISGIGTDDVQIMKSEPAQLDGSSFNGLYIDAREITLTVNIKGSTRKEMYENKLKLISILSPVLNRDGDMGRLEYTNDFGTWWIPAVVKRGPQGSSRIANYLKSDQLVFYCPNPYWRGMISERASMAYLGGGLRFPLRLGQVRFGARGYKTSIWNRGDSPAAMQIEISGPSSQPEILKIRTGEYIRVKRELYEGDILHIDTTPGNPRVTIRRTGGIVETAIGYIDLSSTLFMLDPGENRLQYLSGDDSQTSLISISTTPWFGGV